MGRRHNSLLLNWFLLFLINHTFLATINWLDVTFLRIQMWWHILKIALQLTQLNKWCTSANFLLSLHVKRPQPFGTEAIVAWRSVFAISVNLGWADVVMEIFQIWISLSFFLSVELTTVGWAPRHHHQSGGRRRCHGKSWFLILWKFYWWSYIVLNCSLILLLLLTFKWAFRHDGLHFTVLLLKINLHGVEWNFNLHVVFLLLLLR